MPKNFVVFAERYEHGAGDIGSLNATKKISLPSQDSASAYAFKPHAFKPTLRFVAQTKRVSYADVAYTKHAPNHRTL